MSIIKYIIKPFFIVSKPCTINQYVSYILKSYLLAILFIALSGGIIITIDPYLSKLVGSNSILSDFRKANDTLLKVYGFYSFIVVCIIVPMIEEAIFRHPLALNKSAFPIAFGLLFYRFSGDNFFKVSFLEHTTYLRIVGALLIYFLIYKFQREIWLQNLRNRYFKYFFWFSAFLFATVHISNIPNLNACYIPVYFIYVLPQLIMGLFLGSVQVNRGYWGAVILHFLFNSMSFIF